MPAQAMRTVLVSTYEMGHQPLGLAAPAAALRAAGHDVTCLDLAVDAPEADLFRDANLVGISVPMHTAARLGIALARRVRALAPGAHIAFYGLYATPLHDVLTREGIADSVIGGEYEPALVALADRLAGRHPQAATPAIEGLGLSPAFVRQAYPVPDRAGLPSLDRYARLAIDGEERLAGYVEATRGCAHVCRHCPLTPVYAGRLRLVQPATVLADVDQLVALGARHITFGDPDFLNAVPHALGIVEAMHARHPDVTFDTTIKVEHLLEHASIVPRLTAAGCLFVTSAFESTNDEVLAHLDKGHTAADLDRALDFAAGAGLPLRPTWVAFTPWTSLDDFLALLDFIETRGLVDCVQPVQYALRLLLPPGSPLVPRIEAEGALDAFDGEALTYTWASHDPRVDALQRDLARIVEAAAIGCDHAGGPEPYAETFAKVKRAALEAAGRAPGPIEVLPQPRRTVPGLTESWFC